MTLGSPRVITDQAGNVVSRHDYQAFGEEIIRQNYGTDSIRDKYTGYERDTESGLDFAQARYYNSKNGRFTSVDPLTASANVKDPQTFNRYSYAMNSPYKFTDPLGLMAQGSSDDNIQEPSFFDRVKSGNLRKQDMPLLQFHIQNQTAIGVWVQNQPEQQNSRQSGEVTSSVSNNQQDAFITQSKKGVGTIRLKIFGSKSDSNNLEFAQNSENQSLGSSTGDDGWFWNIEISGEIQGDASKWFIGQRMTWEFSSKIKYLDDSANTMKRVDDPDNPIRGVFTQQEKGQGGKFFAIDSPGVRSSARFNEFYKLTQHFYTYIEVGKKRVGFKWSLYTEVRDGKLIKQIVTRN